MATLPISEDEKAEIQRRIRYEAETGRFFLKIDVPGRGGKAGSEVTGCLGAKGYLRVRVAGRLYPLHRIGWLLETGQWPEQIDHIDHNRTNNKFANLRAVTNSENRLNQGLSHRNKSGINGVDWYARDKKWRVQICINKEHKWLGCYDTIEEARAVREAANREYGFHENHGKKEIAA